MLLTEEQRNWFPETESIPGDQVVKIVEMTRKGVVNLVAKAAAEFKRIDSNFESSSVGKMLLNSNACYRDTVHEESIDVVNFTIVLS